MKSFLINGNLNLNEYPQETDTIKVPIKISSQLNASYFEMENSKDTMNDKKLDNPVWFSLNESHKSVALEYGETFCYHPDYCPLDGFTDLKSTRTALV